MRGFPAVVAFVLALQLLAVGLGAPADATGPTALGRTAWQYERPATYVTIPNGTGFPGQHGDIRYYDYAPAIPAVDSTSWAGCGPGTLCPDANTINMHQSSRLPGCWRWADYTFFQSLVSIPANTDLTSFQIVMNGADDGARVSIINSAYPNGFVFAGSYIFLGGSQSTTDLSPYVVKGEVNRVVVTQVDDCAVENNLNYAAITLNGNVIPVADNDLAIGAAPKDISTAATSAAGAVVTYTAPTASDGGAPVTVTCDHPSGSTFPVGTTTVTCSATDADDTPSSVSVSFTVTVTDTDLAIGAHPDITTAPVLGVDAVVTYTVPVATDEDGTVAVTCDHPSGSTFPLGTTTVTCTASDADDTPSSVSTSFTVTVPFDFGSAGSFVIGDGSANGRVTFWSDRWSKTNVVAGGAAPDAFKGFVGGGTPACGAPWQTTSGNSANPPATVGPYIAVIVSSSISRSGAAISGNTAKVVIVKTDPGYAGSPGHVGTGTVVATLCG